MHRLRISFTVLLVYTVAIFPNPNQTRTDPKPGFCGLPNPKPGFSKKAPGLESLVNNDGVLWDPSRVPKYYNFAWVPHTFGGSDPS